LLQNLPLLKELTLYQCGVTPVGSTAAYFSPAGWGRELEG